MKKDQRYDGAQLSDGQGVWSGDVIALSDCEAWVGRVNRDGVILEAE